MSVSFAYIMGPDFDRRMNVAHDMSRVEAAGSAEQTKTTTLLLLRQGSGHNEENVAMDYQDALVGWTLDEV